MKSRATLLLLLSSLLPVSATSETLRGPVAGTVVVTANGPTTEVVFGMEEIVVIDIADDPRFLDALEIELASPAAVAEVAGAVSLLFLSASDASGREGIVDVVGDELLRRPLRGQGKSFYQVLLHDNANPDRLAATVRPSRSLNPSDLPLVITVVTRMKGLAPDLYNSDFRVSISPVSRNIGALRLQYELENGNRYEPGRQAPDFSLMVNGSPVDVSGEYLLPPGLHRVALESTRYEDYEVTVGVERGTETEIVLPLVVSVARVSYNAPRDAVLYVNGELLPGSTGAFTVAPGEHTITMVMDDYTVTRRFVVEERRTYSLSLSMNIVIEEVN